MIAGKSLDSKGRRRRKKERKECGIVNQEKEEKRVISPIWVFRQEEEEGSELWIHLALGEDRERDETAFVSPPPSLTSLTSLLRLVFPPPRQMATVRKRKRRSGEAKVK